MELKDKVAIVTGAARGLGKSTVEELLVKGVKVCFCDVNVEGGEEVLSEFVDRFGDSNVVFKTCDVRKENELKDLIASTNEKFQRLDIFINNAAIADETNWEEMIDVNIGGCIRGTTLAVESLRKDKGGNGGVIVNVSSLSAFEPTITAPRYSSTKYAILGFSRGLSLQSHIKSNGIRIVCLCPNMIDTPLLRQRHEEATGTAQLRIKKMVSELGILSMKPVVEGIIKILQDEDNNGKQLYVDPTFGIGYRTVTDPVGEKFLSAQII